MAKNTEVTLETAAEVAVEEIRAPKIDKFGREKAQSKEGRKGNEEMI